MTIYVIEGKNAQGASGSWEIEAKDKESVEKIIKARGIQADTINGEDVKWSKAPTPKEKINDGV